MKNKILYIFVAILIVRIFIGSFSYNNDMNNHFAWSQSMKTEGLNGFYERDFSPFAKANYPPGANFSYMISDYTYDYLGIDNQTSRALLLKMPAIIIESVAISFVALLFGPLLGLLFFLNPAIIYNTLLWGQTEGLMASLILFALYCLSKKRTYLASVLFIMALLVKQSAIIFAPIYLIYLFKNNKLDRSIYSLFLSIGIFLISFIPFYSVNFGKGAFEFLVNESAGQAHQALSSVNALNFWYLLGQNELSDALTFIVSYRSIGMIIVSLITLAVLYRIIRKNVDYLEVLYSAAIINFAVCMFLTRIHERHLLPSLIFLIPIISLRKKLFPFYIAISLIHFYNVYLVWNESFRNGNYILFAILSLILIGVFFYLLIDFFKATNRKELPKD